MKALALLFLCTCARAQAAHAIKVNLALPETSAPLHELARQEASTPVTALRVQSILRVTPAMRGQTLHRPGRAAAPASPLPTGAEVPPLAQVATGGAQLLIDGLTAAGVVPADIAGAAGATQYLQWVNSRIAVYDKDSGAVLLGPVDGTLLFRGMRGSPAAAACGQTGGGSVQVNFDKRAQRWIISRMAGPLDGPYVSCVAVSLTPDALGSFHRYVLPIASRSGKPVYGDDQHLSVWSDAYYLTFTVFHTRQGGYLGPRVCALDRAAMLAGAAAHALCWDLGKAAGPVLAAGLDSSDPPPDGSSNHVLALDFANDGRGEHLLAWRISYTRASLSAVLQVPVAPFTIACPGSHGGACIAQPEPGEPLDAVGDRLMDRLAYRNMGSYQSLLASHSVQQAGALRDGAVGVRWYELRDTDGRLSVYQQGTVAPDANSRWLGSMAMDKAGNIALSYSIAGPATHPGLRYTGRVRTDPPGRMEREEVLVNGSGAQLQSFGLWGHAGTMSVDPLDDCRFWTAQQYIATTGVFTWRSKLARFAFRSCQ